MHKSTQLFKCTGESPEISAMLNSFGFQISPRIGEMGDYVIERAFVEQ